MTAPLSLELRVRYFDVDERRVVNNARYLNYFEEARMDLIDLLRDRHGADLRGGIIVAHAECDYLRPLVLRDRVRIDCGIGRIGNSSFDVLYQLFNQRGEPVATGRTTQVRYDYDAGRPLSLTDTERAALAACHWEPASG